MKLGGWIPMGSLILLMCAHQGDATLILGSMLMAATAAMTGGLIMGPLTIGGLVMMMMMAANNQNAQQRQTQQSSTNNIASTLENSQNLLNLLATLTGAASNLAGSASTQQASLVSPTHMPKAAKRALYNPNNFGHEQMLRRQWKSISEPTTTTSTTARTPHARAKNDFWNTKPTTYFSPDTGFAVEPIPDDLLDIAMRLPQAKTANMFGDLFDDGTVSPTTASGTGSSSAGTTAPEFNTLTSPPRPISSAEQQLRWVASEPGDLFSSFPELKEEDILNLIRKRSTREALQSKFRLEDIANVTYANDKDPVVQEQLNEREKQEEVNTRIFRQLSALDPFRCLPQLACNMQAAPPSRQTGILNDYAYLLKTVFERDDDDDDEKEDSKPASTSVKKQASSSSSSGNGALNVASDIISALTSQSKRKKKLDYKSPSKSATTTTTQKGSSKTAKSDGDKQDEEDDDDDDGFSSEEIPMDEDEVERLMMKEQYEMEQNANEELLNDDPDLLPYVLKSASKGPPYLGPDRRPSPVYNPNVAPGTAQADFQSPTLTTGAPSMRPRPTGFGGRVPGGAFVQPSPLFSNSDLTRYRTEDLDKMSSSELANLLRQVSGPDGEEIQIDEGTFGDSRGSLAAILSGIMPSFPQMSVGFTRRRTHTGKPAFDDDPFFDDFDFRRRSMRYSTGSDSNQEFPRIQRTTTGQPRLRKVRRVVRKVKETGPAARVAYLRRMKRVLDAETDPAEVFRMATEAGAKIKSPRQCRFLFNGCPLNSTQLLGMIGNIRKAVVGLSNAQTLLSGNVNLASLAQQTQTAKDYENNLATIGPNVVTFAPSSPTTTTTVAPPPAPTVHQLAPMAQMQFIQPVLGVPQSAVPPPPAPPVPQPIMPPAQPQTSSSSQNTIVVPQIVQVPMPIHTQQAASQPQPIIFQQQPMQYPQQNMMQYQPQGQNMNPIFNMVSDSSAQNNGATSISHELPSGEKLEISMTVKGQGDSQPSVITIPVNTKTRKKPTIPQSSLRPGSSQTRLTARPAAKNPAADLVDLFDDDSADNYLLPTKALIETEIKPPSTSIDSLQAAILAIEKINQAANDKKKSKPTYLEDDESDDFTGKGASRRPTTPAASKIVPSGMRLPNKKDENDEEEDDETSEEEEEEEGDEYRFRSRLPDPLDPKRRNFVPVPTKEAQFQDAAQLTIPATQTFSKKRLQVEESSGASSSEEGEQKRLQQRRMVDATRRKLRRPRILYPQEDVGKPVFIPL